METETVAFGYRARALVFEQRVRRPLAIRDMRRFVNGGRRPRHTNLRLEFSFPVPLTDVQDSSAPEFSLPISGNTPGIAANCRRAGSSREARG
jgi:hypothetical protein